MKHCFVFLLLATLANANIGLAQVGGNVAYSQVNGRARAEQSEQAHRTLTQYEVPPNNTSVFIDASVLMNVKADEFVATFAVSREGKTLAECNDAMDLTIRGMTKDLKELGIAPSDIFVDYIAQSKTYGYHIDGNVAKEELTGFELKKNVLVHYKDKELLDRLTLAAARAQVFDLVKVDYVVRDTGPIHDQLVAEAARIIKQKVKRYEALLDVKLPAPPQVYTERHATHFPTEMYDSYTAFESENIDHDQYRSKYLVQSARKGHTFYYNPLTAAGFDSVLEPVITEPVVQFTVYLKVRYEISPGATDKPQK